MKCRECNSKDFLIARDGKTYHTDNPLMRVLCLDCKDSFPLNDYQLREFMDGKIVWNQNPFPERFGKKKE